LTLFGVFQVGFSNFGLPEGQRDKKKELVLLIGLAKPGAEAARGAARMNCTARGLTNNLKSKGSVKEFGTIF
jgi:hypothetical protein